MKHHEKMESSSSSSRLKDRTNLLCIVIKEASVYMCPQ